MAHNPYLHMVEHGVKRHNKRLGNTFDQIIQKIKRGAGKPVMEYASPPKIFYDKSRRRGVLTWTIRQRTDYAFRPEVYLTFNLRLSGTDHTHKIVRTFSDTSISLVKFRKELPKLFWKYYAGRLQ